MNCLNKAFQVYLLQISNSPCHGVKFQGIKPRNWTNVLDITEGEIMFSCARIIVSNLLLVSRLTYAVS